MGQMKTLCNYISGLLVLLMVVTASGELITVDFSLFHNNRMQGSLGSAEHPEGDVVLGTIPFSIPTGGNNRWTAEYPGPNPHQIDTLARSAEPMMTDEIKLRCIYSS